MSIRKLLVFCINGGQWGLVCSLLKPMHSRRRKKRKAPKVTKVVYKTPPTTGKMAPSEPFVIFDREEPITPWS